MTEQREKAAAEPPLDCNVMREHDPNHPYVRKLVGCGHGRLFSEPCVDCEVVGLLDEYKRAVRTVQRVRDRMRQLGRPMPGQTSLPTHNELSSPAAKQSGGARG